MHEQKALVLEVAKHGDTLKMAVFEKEPVSTLRHYSQCRVDFDEANQLCAELNGVLNKPANGKSEDPEIFNSLKKIGQLLWEHLLTKQVKDRLKSSPIVDLILSIDEPLVNVPWELFYDGSNFLCLNFNLGRLVRTTKENSFVQYRSFSGVPKMLILANPTNDLKSAYLEGLNIKNQFDRRRDVVHIDFKSTNIDKLYVKKNLRDYDIVHFAGHCEFKADEPDNSGWVLNDGVLTGRDILDMGQTLALPALLFSNACNCAKENRRLDFDDCQEKNYSFASAFLFSGVRHYIGATRKIEDPVSFVFSKEFYHQLILGRSVGESIRLGRLQLMKEYGIAACYWASYLLYGDPNFVLFKARAKPQKIKLKDRLAGNKKLFGRILVGASAAFILFVLFMRLPSKDPAVYYMFVKANSLYASGSNRELIALSEKIIKKDPSYLAIYPVLANTFLRSGDKTSALKAYFDYALLCEKKRDLKQLASAYTQIGWFYYLDSKLDKAVGFYNKALSISRENKDKLNESIALRKLAVWHISKEEYDTAIELLLKSSEIDRERQHIKEFRYNLACDYFNMGLLFSDKEDFSAAKEFYDKSRRLFERLKLKNELSDYYFNLGEIALFEKSYQKALDYYFAGLKIDLTQGNKFNLVTDYSMLGELYLEMDNLKEAELNFIKSAELAKEIDCQLELAEAYSSLGLLFKKKGVKSRAREYLRQAQEIYKELDLESYKKAKKELASL